MLFILRFTDKPDSLHIREKHYSAHIAWLDAHADSVLVAGVMKATADGPNVAALWIVSAASSDAALSLSDTDPFWMNGLRASREVFHYKAHSALEAIKRG
ncbi:MAG: YciI family protein [Pseudomonadota bacterium]